VIVVNYGGSTTALRSQLDGNIASVKVISIPGQRYFNKPVAQNLGAFAAKMNYLFFCDCDIIIEPTLLCDFAETLGATPTTFLTVGGLTETGHNSRGARNVTCFGYQLYIKVSNGRELRIIDQEEDANSGTRHAPGLLGVRREHFLAVNGYNSQLDGWGWEDQDIICRLTLGLGLVRETKGHVHHISHDDLERTKAFPYSDRWTSRDLMFRRCLARYDEGIFTGSYAEDVKSFEPALVAPNDFPI
jgi:hypothetical protein